MRQHWVPRFQLEHFAIDRDANPPRVRCIPLDGRAPFVTSVSNVLCKKHLNTLSNPEYALEVERRLALLEGYHAPYLSDWGSVPIGPEPRRFLAALLAAQYLRTPRMFAWWNECFAMIGKCYQLASEFIPASPPGQGCEAEEGLRWIANASDDQRRNHAARQIIERGKELTSVLADRPWAFLRSPTGKFATADEPVRVAAHGRSRLSLQDKGAIAYWPITPSCALLVGVPELDDGAAYTVAGHEGCLNQWLASDANMLITGRDADIVLDEIAPHLGEGLPVFYKIV